MELKAKDKWIYSYTYPCHKGKLSVFDYIKENGDIKNALKGNFSRNRVRDYFFRIHNPKTLGLIKKNGQYLETDSIHLLVPYQVGSKFGKSLAGRIHESFYKIGGLIPARIFKEDLILQAMELEILEDSPKEGNILLVHGDYIVDVVQEQDLRRYYDLFRGKEKKRKK